MCVVKREEGRMSWCVDPSIHNTEDPCYYVFLSLYPCGNGAVMIMRYYFFPKDDLPQRNFFYL